MSKAVAGVVWSSVQRFGTIIISFVSNMVLARLLQPSDFGTIGMLTIFLAIANTFIDSGLGSALIQKKSPSQDDFSTVFVTNLILSLFLYGILFFLSPHIASFYKIPLLNQILRIEGIVLLINSFCIVQTTILRKNLDFKRLAIANIIGNVIGTIVGIFVALAGHGLWSLVIRLLVVSFTTTILLWSVSSWRPKIEFSILSFKELFSFGSFVLLSSIITTLSNNIQTLIIGKLFNTNTLGMYTQAKQLRDIPSTSISSIISQVLYPVFSNIQDNNKEIGQYLNKSISLISYITTVIIGLLILTAEPLIIIIYSEKWIDCVPLFQILCLGGIFLGVQDINYYVIASKGKSKILFYANLSQVVLGIAIMLLGGIYYGIYGLLVAMVISTFIFYCVYASIATHYLHLSIFTQIKNIFIHLAIGAIAVIATHIICKGFHTSFVLEITLNFFIYISTFILLSHILRLKSYKQLLNIILSWVRKR